MRQLCAEASMYPVRDIIESSCLDIATVPLEQVLVFLIFSFSSHFLYGVFAELKNFCLGSTDFSARFCGSSKNRSSDGCREGFNKL